MLNLRLIAVVAAMLTLMLSAAVMAVEEGQSAPPFKLADQFGKTWDLESLKGSVVVVVAANRDSGREMGPWVDNLKEKYGERIQLLGLIELRGIPGFARGMARSRIRKETKEPLMIDFSGSTGKAYSVNSEDPVVVLIDKSGTARSVVRSAYSETAFKPLSAAVDKALR